MTDDQFRQLMTVLTAQTIELNKIGKHLQEIAIQGGAMSPAIDWREIGELFSNAAKITKGLD